MPGPVRLLPFCLPENGHWPPRAAPPPDHAELAAHLVRQLAGWSDAGSPSRPATPRPEGRAGSAEPNRGGVTPAGRPHPGSKLRFDSPSPPVPAPPGGREKVAGTAPPQQDEERRCGRPGVGATERSTIMPVSPFGRPEPSVRAATSKLVDMIGLHLICPETRCRRARRCADPDRTQLPLCFWLHRGTCRFVVACLAARLKTQDAEPVRARGRGRDVRDASLLAGLRRSGWPIERLARSREDGADEWSWERVPEARAMVSSYGRR